MSHVPLHIRASARASTGIRDPVASVADTHGIDPAVLRPRFGERRPPAGQSEQELVARVQSGDDWAF